VRQDQYEKLQQLSEKLLDVFMVEADPEHWPGKGVRPGDMDSKTRGDLYWVRKTAASVLMLESRIATRIASMQLSGAGTTPAAEGAPEDDGIEAEVKAAEREAQALMDELQKGTRKKAFDKRVHGGP
jgi:hypothetical protein